MRLSSLKQLANLRYKNRKLKIGLCHGVFDIIHNGHVEHFKDAKKKVDILVVSITTKEMVNKGPRQPLNNNANRLNVLKSIKFIDYVYLNKEKDSKAIIKNLKPNIYFKGLDYLNNVRSTLGAKESRLQSTIRNLSIADENISAAIISIR